MTARRVVLSLAAAGAVGWVAGWVLDVVWAHRVCAAERERRAGEWEARSSRLPANLVRLPNREKAS